MKGGARDTTYDEEILTLLRRGGPAHQRQLVAYFDGRLTGRQIDRILQHLRRERKVLHDSKLGWHLYSARSRKGEAA